MSSDRSAIVVSGVSKRYALFRSPAERLRRSASIRMRQMFGRSRPESGAEFSALSDISFEVGRGETVGIVGRNGSGKSTLLQIICGTLAPTNGQVQVNGRIAALLELGSGFNPEYTGRDNVFLNSAILGASEAETRSRLDQILEFADIGRFIDQPVKTYSSGMYVRLAFATAINVDPDILIVDEALAVGDEAFQRKCFARLRQIQEQGATILFVSHNAQSVISLCNRAILLDEGQMLLEGAPKEVTGQYQRLVHARREDADAIRQSILTGSWRVEDKSVPTEDQDVAPHESGQKEDAAPAGKAGATDAPEMPSVGDKLKDSVSGAGRMAGFLDPALQPSSTVSFDPNGGSVREVFITDEAGSRCNKLEHGSRYWLNLTAAFTRDFNNVTFAMILKTIVGDHLAGQWSHCEGEGLSVRAGDVVSVAFPFENRLAPGTYFANSGMFSSDEGEFMIIHRILDALMFKVLPYEQSEMTRGYIDLRPEGVAARCTFADEALPARQA